MRFLQCPQCKKEYDKAQHFPKLLIPCGHTVCLRCVPLPTTQNWKCPTCKRASTCLNVSQPNNISVVQLLDNLQGLSSGSLNLTLRCGDSVLVSKDLPSIRTVSIKALLVSVAARGQLQKSGPSAGRTSSDVMQCPQCCTEYDKHNHSPKIVTPCAHPACLNCLWQSQQKCPTCQQEFDGLAKGLPNNISVLQLQKNVNRGYGKKPLNLILRDEDRVLLCKELTNSGDPLIKALLVADEATPTTTQPPEEKSVPWAGHVMHFLRCPNCYKEYDKAQHFPKLVIPCGHPICLRCVPLLTKRNWKCPTCVLEYRGLHVSPPNNTSMAQLLDNLQGLSSGSLNLTLRCGDSVLVYKSLSNIRTPRIKALLVSVAARGQLQKPQSGPSKGRYSDVMQCPICCNGYDKARHFPKVVTPCAHPACLNCLLKSQECPTCDQEFNGRAKWLPKNISVLQLLDNLYGLCDMPVSLTLQGEDGVLLSKELTNSRDPLIKALLVADGATPVTAQPRKEKKQKVKQPKNAAAQLAMAQQARAQPARAQAARAQPETAQPATGQPATGQPATGQTATSQPAKGQTATTQPPKQKVKKERKRNQPKDAAAQPATAQPATAQPATAQPAAAQPATAQLATAQSATAQPATAQSATGRLATGQLAKGQPAKGQPATAQPPKQKVKKERKRNEPKDAAVPVPYDIPHNSAASRETSPVKNGHTQPKGAALREVHFDRIRSHDRVSIIWKVHEVERLVDVRCDLHPEMSLDLLQIALPSVVELSLVNPNAEHLSEVQNMPHLRRLSVHGFDASRGHMPLISLARRQLRWLRVRDLQDEALRRLLTAYTPPFSDALEELQLWVNTAPVALQKWETCCNTLLSLVYKLDLQELRKLVLKWGLSHPHDKNDCAAILCNLQEEMPKTEILCLDCGTWGAF